MNLPKDFFRSRAFSFTALAFLILGHPALVTIAGLIAWVGIAVFVLVVLVGILFWVIPEKEFTTKTLDQTPIDSIFNRRPLVSILDWSLTVGIVYFLYSYGWVWTSILYGFGSVTTILIVLPLIKQKMERVTILNGEGE
jgi:hypothetical protein